METEYFGVIDFSHMSYENETIIRVWKSKCKREEGKL